VSVDILGIFLLSLMVLALLTAFLLAGEGHRWLDPRIVSLFALTAVSGIAFYAAENRAKEPVLPMGFFSVKGFRTGNGAVFCSSFAIFSLAAYIPLFIQGALGKSPAQMGMAMVSLSLAWSCGSLMCGQMAHIVGHRVSAIMGAAFLSAGSGMALSFTPQTGLWACYIALALAGLGMGYVSLSTLLIVQNSLDKQDLGMATASNQFSRTLAGTIGVGISGSLVTARMTGSMEDIFHSRAVREIPPDLLEKVRQSIETLFEPDVQSRLSAQVLDLFQNIMAQGVMMVFILSLAAALVCFLFCLRLPKGQ
jgi:Na+/melibiose symporter-like transporter